MMNSAINTYAHTHIHTHACTTLYYYVYCIRTQNTKHITTMLTTTNDHDDINTA